MPDFIALQIRNGNPELAPYSQVQPLAQKGRQVSTFDLHPGASFGPRVHMTCRYLLHRLE